MNIEELYRAIAPRLTNWLVASGSSYHEACDLVQNTFLKIWKMRDDLHDDESAVSGLAFTIARNLRKNLARDNARLTFVGEIRDADEDEPGGASADGESLAARLSTADTSQSGSDAEYLRRGLYALPDRRNVDTRRRKSDRSERKSRKSANFPCQGKTQRNSCRFACNLMAPAV